MDREVAFVRHGKKKGNGDGEKKEQK